MAKSYSKAPDECHGRVGHLIKLFRPDLRDAGLTIDLISVTNDDPEGEALTHQGYPAYAVVRVVDSKGRTMGRGDAEIVIDEAKYITMTDAQKDALFDHEIHHIELKLNKKGRVKLDENGRPKIGLRKHDIQVGWFEEIAKRHGAASLECKQATQIYLQHTQTLFAFIREPSRVEAGERSPNALRNFVKNISAGMKEGESLEISTPGSRGVTIDKDGVRKK
jgi:hypothetical protein